MAALRHELKEAIMHMAARHVLATCDVPAERCRAATLDRTHHLQLIEADMAAVVGLAPSGTVVAEDVLRPPEPGRTTTDGAIAPARLPQCRALRACGAARSRRAERALDLRRLFRSPRRVV